MKFNFNATGHETYSSVFSQYFHTLLFFSHWLQATYLDVCLYWTKLLRVAKSMLVFVFINIVNEKIEEKKVVTSKIMFIIIIKSFKKVVQNILWFPVFNSKCKYLQLTA